MENNAYNGRVLNLATGQWSYYFSTLPPRDAVIAAYAQSKGDNNTWDYKERYSHLVKESERCVICGDFTTFKRVPDDKGV